MSRRFLATLAALIAVSCTPPSSAVAQGAGRIESIRVHGASLDGNLAGIPAERAVSVYLPPSYGQGNRRYPVVYLLHGILDSNTVWTSGWAPHPGYATIQELMDRGISSGTLQEMIVVMPDADKTCHYTDSPVKGGWASFVMKDLVGYVDRTYRTVAGPQGRGILGHSMGGHGAIKLAMLNPGTFSAVYAMNPSLLGMGGDVSPDNPQIAALSTLTSPADAERAGFYTQAVVGIGQCFSPNPAAPLRMDAPFSSGGGPGAGYAKWQAQMPVYMAPTHADALRQLRGLRFDSAFEDEFAHIPIATRAFSRVLDSLGVAHTFEMYNGDHRNRLWGPEGRLYTAALPFFSRLLDATPVAVSSGGAAPPATAPTAAVQESLWDAARRGDIRRAERALADGADIHALDTLSNEGGRSGRRALNFAALHNRADMVRWLVGRGANASEPNKTGFTPLHHAAESGAVNAVQALLAVGADPNAKLPSGSTPLAVARQRRHANIVRLLEPVTRVP